MSDSLKTITYAETCLHSALHRAPQTELLAGDSGAWTVLAVLPAGRPTLSRLAAVNLHNTVYAVGGYDGRTNLDIIWRWRGNSL